MSSERGMFQNNSPTELQPKVEKKGPTVDELLQMLSRSNNYKRTTSPPPVPPKPKQGMGMSIEAAKRSLGLIPTVKSTESNKHMDHVQLKADGDTGSSIGMSKEAITKIMFNSTELKIDCQNTNSSHESTGNTSSAKESHIFSRPLTSRLSAPFGSCVIYDSSCKANNKPKVNERTNDNMLRQANDCSKTQPIVTELLDEANHDTDTRLPKNSTSTVEILEVPVDSPTNDIHGNGGNKTFTKTQKRPTGGLHGTDSLIQYSDSNSESAINESIDNQPLRSSTPTPMHYQIDNDSSSGASTATNNNRSSHETRETASDNSEGDTLNISRDTDDLTNTSTHNQSGCELVGIDDAPGSKDSSPKKNETNDLNQTNPYTVQIFNETLLSTASSPQTNIFSMSAQQPENLTRVVLSLQDEIKSLKSKVTHLTSKLSDLEYLLDRQKSSPTINKSTSSVYTRQSDDGPPSTNLKKNLYSRSVSTINKLTPMKNSRHNVGHGQMSSYSRNSMAAINSHNIPSTPTSSSSGMVQKTNTTPNSERLQAQKFTNGFSNTNLSLKRLPVHASENSINAQSNKSDSASISPTPLGSINRLQAISPYSSLAKRDQSQHASMLSLSTISNFTLKNSSIAGSVSNLSQFDASSHLANWSSRSNSMLSPHQNKDILYDEGEQIIRMVLYNNLITMRVPSWLSKEYNLDQIVDAPDVKLKLNWVYGYRGRDCRSNVHYLPTGECVYFVASIVVLYNPDAKTQRHYLGHTESVKCLAIHPNKLIVASGQAAVPNRKDKRPIVRVWNTANLATLRVIEFNEDFDRSICCLAFSRHDTGATLAVVDESSEHTITLLDWQKEKNWRLAEVNSGHEPVLALDFHPIDKYSLVAVGKATINFWDIRGFTMAKKTGLFDRYDKPKYVLCMSFNDLGETITGDSNGNVIIWPRGTNKPRRVIRDAHQGGVFSVLASRDGTYLTGGRDRRIIEWDEAFEQTGRQLELAEHCGGVRFITTAKGTQILVGTLRNTILIGSLDNGFSIIMQGHTEAATALSIHPNEPKYLTGGFYDQIFFINSETHSIEWTQCLAMPVTAASFSPNGYLLIVGSTSGNWVAMEANTQDILFTACNGSGTINCIKFSPDGQSFCMGSSDCQVYVYQTNEPGSMFRRVGTCVGHSAPVKEIDWSEDNGYFQSQSMNFELLFWRAEDCRQVDDDNIVHDLKWATQNCTIGFNVLGIWSDSIDSALVNHCDKSNNRKYIVATTDTGCINIYRWPTYYNQCHSQKYFGNVDEFDFIKFLSDDSRLVAVGAKSCVTTEWTIED